MMAIPHEPFTDAAAVWDRLPCVVLVLALDGSAVHVNRRFREFTALDDDAALGHGWLGALAAESRRDLLAELTQRDDFSLQLRMLHADGSSAWVDCAGAWQPGGTHCVCVMHDVTQGKLAEIKAHAKAEQFRLLADNVPVLIAYYEARGLRCLFANKEYARAFDVDERSILGLTVPEVVGEAANEQIQPHIELMMQRHQAVTYERELALPGGDSRTLEVNLLPHIGADGQVQAAFVLIADITKYRLAERAVRESEDRLAKFMQASAEGIVFHRKGLIVDANPTLCQLLGYTLEELIGRKTQDFIAPDQLPKVSAMVAAGRDENAYETALLHKDGMRIPVEFIVRTLERNGERMRMTIARDIRDRQAAQARIHHLAHHDALTGLPNRMSFIEQLEDLMTSDRAGDAHLALLFIDLDHFKRVNDSLGHLVGDTLLQIVAARITSCLRGSDLVARFGGDEFMVLLPGAARRADIEEVAQKLLASIGAPVDAEGRPLSVTPSVGIALYPEHGRTPTELLQHADAAMYRAKSRGRANFQFYDPGTADAAYAALVMEGELAEAIARNEFVLHFQPQVRAADGALVGVEALLRWLHPVRGLLLPDAFIPVAEQRRLMLAIGQWVLREATRSAQRWRGLGLQLPVAVNLSSLQFHAGNFVQTVAQALGDSGLPGHLLELELTERMLMDDLVQVKTTLAQLKQLGIRVSVDDFGTGYTSLGHLKELPIDRMKIDRSFVHDLPQRRDSAAIASAIIQMARSLGITVIAEGVETEVQRRFLTEQGCDELQGWAISAPLEAQALLAWIEARRAR